MSDDDYNLNRRVSDFFDEALGLGLADDIKNIDCDRYLPGSEIARGGMKSIEVAVDTVTGREIAKALLIGTDDPEKVERFFHEARICASLEHPNIVPVYDAGFDSAGKPFFTMRLLGGLTLQKKVKKGEAKIASLVDSFVKVCDAVAYAHSQGIIHRDLKPDNIQIGDFGEVQVCDWGLACRDGYKKKAGEKNEVTKEYVIPVTLDGMIKGTPGYLSPEQAASDRTELTAKSDIYSLGAILYFILTKKAPLEGFDIMTSVKRTLTGDIPPIKDSTPDAPNSLIAICHKAMIVEVEDRYQTVEELKKDIVKYQHGFPTAAEEAGAWESLKLLIKRNKRTATLTAAFFIIFNTALIWFLINLSIKEQKARKAEIHANLQADKALKAEKEARESETDAKRSAELAEMSARATEEAMSKLAISVQKTEKALADLKSVSKKAAPRFIRLGKMDRARFYFIESLELLNQALLLDPANEDTLTSKGKVLMGLMRYEEALECFKNLQNINKQIPVVCNVIKDHLNGRTKITLEDLLLISKLYKKHNIGSLYHEELIYSPALDFLTQDERQLLAVDSYLIYHHDKKTSFLEMKKVIERKMPHLLYKTGVDTFDLRRFTKTRIYMVRGERTERVLLPAEFNVNIILEDLKLCPNLKEIYVLKLRPEYKQFQELNIQILTYKDLP
jgi:serine/threonine protein kinase